MLFTHHGPLVMSFEGAFWYGFPSPATWRYENYYMSQKNFKKKAITQ